ncbi:MAG: cysteine rich repeat-containing protein [Pseudomonadota bacterium]
MKHTIVSGACLALATLVTTPAPAADILGACATEIENRCSDVTVGHGRVMACLYSYEDQVGETCGTAMADAADMIDLFFERMRYVAQQCRADVAAHCSDTEVGEGRMMSCLSQASGVSEGCSAAIAEIRVPTE